MVQPAAVDPGEADERIDLRRLGRLALWGVLAVGAAVAAFASARTEYGLRRINAALHEPQFGALVANAPVVPGRGAETDAATQRLTQEVQTLAADRDRIQARLAMLERTIETTGSVPSAARNEAQAAPSDAGRPVASVTLIPPRASTGANEAARDTSAPDARKRAEPAATAALEPARQAVPAPAVEPVVTRTQFGIDLGAAGGIEALREVWNAARTQHAPLLDNFQPLVAVRETGRPGSVELHLIAGPLVNAAAAARLCAVVGAAGATCQPSIFEGQRFAWR